MLVVLAVCVGCSLAASWVASLGMGFSVKTPSLVVVLSIVSYAAAMVAERRRRRSNAGK